MKKNIKVFVSHRIDLESFKIDNNIYVPVRCGACFDKRENPDMIGDDTGVNISDKRESYCELTVQYWAWKNVNADYYGLCHYRRYLSFNEADTVKRDSWSNVIVPRLDENSCREHFLNDCEYIQNKVSQYDIITMIPADMKDVDRKSVYEQYKKDGNLLHISDIDTMLDIIDEMYPEFSEVAHAYINGTKAYFGNIFIMNKKLFHDYCAWLFDILEEFEKRVDMSSYSVEGYRTPGHLGERLFGIYYTWLKTDKQIRSLELPLVVFKDTAIVKKISPAFSQNNIPVVFSCSEQYSTFCAASIQSLIDVSSHDNNYDIFILNRNLSKETKRKFFFMLEGKKNISLRFIDMSSIVSQYNLYETPTISCETYFRLIIPELFIEYNKVLYLDSDIIIRRDIAELYTINLDEHWLGAVHDICEAANINNFNEERRNYVKNYMRLRNIYKEFNAGILLINTKAFRNNFTTRYLFEFCEAGAFQFQDQDALNILCEDKILWIDMRWNFVPAQNGSYTEMLLRYAPRDAYKVWSRSSEDPWIIHYIGNIKPWYNSHMEFSEYFWSSLQKTPFYHTWIKIRIIDHILAYKEKNNPSLVPSHVIPYNTGVTYKRHYVIYKYWIYKIISSMTLGKLHRKMDAKRKKYKNLYFEFVGR